MRVLYAATAASNTWEDKIEMVAIMVTGVALFLLWCSVSKKETWDHDAAFSEEAKNITNIREWYDERQKGA